MPNARAKTVIADTVMQQIDSGTVSMRPGVYYALLSMLTVLATAAAGVVIAYLTSILIFVGRIATANTMALGARAKLDDAVAAFPWWLLGVAIVLGALAVWLVRRQGRLYKYHVTTVVSVIVVVSLALGLVFSAMNIGQPYAERHMQMTPAPGQGQGLHRQKMK